MQTTNSKTEEHKALIAIHDPYSNQWKTVELINGSIRQAGLVLLSDYPDETQALSLVNGGTIMDLRNPKPQGNRHRALSRWITLVKRFKLMHDSVLYTLENEVWGIHTVNRDGSLRSRRLADMVGLENLYHKGLLQGMDTVPRKQAEPGDYCLYRCGGYWMMEQVEDVKGFPTLEWLDRWGQHPTYLRRGSTSPRNLPRDNGVKL